MNYIINFISKLKFKIPPKKKIVILDKYLPQYLNKKTINNSFCLNYREIDYYLNIILLMFFKNIFPNKEKYIESLVKFINPKLILTFIDNDPFLWSLKKKFPKIKICIIQNGYRSVHNDVFGVLNKIKVIEKYKVDGMFVFNNSIVEQYSKYIDSKYFVIGSFRSNNNLLKHYKTKRDYIVFVSEYVEKGKLNKNYDHKNYYSRENKILPILEKFCMNNNLILKILCRNKLNKNFKIEEKKFFEKILNKKKNFEYIYSKSLDQHFEVIDNAKFTVFFTSTVGYESLSRGNRIAGLCVKNEVVKYESKNDLTFGWPANLRSKGSFWTNSSKQSEIMRVLNYVNNISLKSWTREINKINIEDIIVRNEKNTIFYNFINKLLN